MRHQLGSRWQSEKPAFFRRTLTKKCNTMKGICFKSIQLLALMGVLGPTSFSNADEPTPEATGSRILVRISREFIGKHNLPLVDEVAPINRCLFGAHVTGESHTRGTTTVNMDIEDGGDTVFTFHFAGTTVSQTVATTPVAVYSTGTTVFEAQCAIRFDGLRFTAEAATITATHSTTIDCVATPCGSLAALRTGGPGRRFK